MVQRHLGTLGEQALELLVTHRGPDPGDQSVVLGEVAGMTSRAEDPQRLVRSADQDGTEL